MNSYNAFQFFNFLCKQSYMQPRVVEFKMRKHFESTRKYQNKLWTRNLLERLTQLCVGTNEIQIHASKQVKNMNNINIVSKYKGIIHQNMVIKLDDAIQNEEQAKTDMVQSCIELKREVNLNTITGYEYTSFMDKIWKKDWNIHKNKCNEKTIWLSNQQQCELEMIVQNKSSKSSKIASKNVNKSGGLEMIVQDKSIIEEGELEMTVQEISKTSESNDNNQNGSGLEKIVQHNSFKEVLKHVQYKDEDMKNIECDSKPVNLGVDNVNENVQKLLSKPPGYRIFKDIKTNDVDVNVEETFAKLRINMLNDDTENNVHNVSKNQQNSVTLKNIRATDMKYNKRVFFVDSYDLNFETKCSNLKIELLKVLQMYKSQNPNIKFSNLTNNELEGLKDAIKLIEAHEAVVFQTDKSKKFSIDKPENYINDMEKYIEGNQIVDMKFVNKVTRLCNEVNKSLLAILEAGGDYKQEKRIKNNVITTINGEIPVICGLFKDHKTGRNFRQLVNGNVGPIANTSNILSVILVKYVNKFKEKVGDTSSKSTEEMLAKFVSYNESVDRSKIGIKEKFIASMDVEALYPSLRTGDCAKLVKTVVRESELSIGCEDTREMGIFLRKHMSNSQINSCGLCEFIPKRQKKLKKTETNTNDDPWIFEKVSNDENDKKKLFAEVLAICVEIVMNNHVYKFKDKIILQKDEGGMGVELTGVLADLKMLIWGLTFKEKLVHMNIENDLDDRYVDDITLLPTVLPPGLKFEDDKLVLCEDKIKEDSEIPGDIRTMKIIQAVANSIDENIKVTFDVPSNHDDEKVPILDLKVNLNKDNRKIEYSFYKKPMAAKVVIMKNSAMSSNVKYATLTQQCFKRIHNTCESTPFEIKVELLNQFMFELWRSGYDEKERLAIMQGGYRTHEKIVSKVNKGLRPYYRHSALNQEGRKCEKQSKKNSWFKNHQSKIHYAAVMFVDATPGDELLKMFKHIECKYRISDQHRIKFVSKSGMKLANVLQKRDPFPVNCNDAKCVPSKAANSKGKIVNCKKANICYKVECQTCKDKGISKVYYGETSRNLHVRSAEHYRDCEDQNNKNSWMRKHIENDHENESGRCEFEWSIVNSFRKPMLRQLTEAVYINNTKNDECLNLKNEYFKNNINGIQLSKDKSYICSKCGGNFETRNDLTEYFKAVHASLLFVIFVGQLTCPILDL